MSAQNLQGQVALVTGASRGIGRAIATELARQGAKVVGTATSEAGAAAISEYLAALGPEAGRGVVLNVNDARPAWPWWSRCRRNSVRCPSWSTMLVSPRISWPCA